jgi:hypothetical protein
LDLRGRKWQEAGEDCTMRNFITYTLHQIVSCDQIIEDEMGRACSFHGRDEMCVQNLAGKTEGMRSLRRPMRSWDDNVGVNLRELG